MRSKLFAAIGTLSAVFLLLVSCGETRQPEEAGITVRMSVTAEGTVILNDVEVTVTDEHPTVMDAFRKAVSDDDGFPDVRYDNDDHPMSVLDVASFLENSEKMWMFRVNNKTFDSTKGRAGNYGIKDGDRIYFEYLPIIPEK